MDDVIERPSEATTALPSVEQVRLSGELDLAAFEGTRDLIVGAGRAAGVVVDLSAVTFIDSSGLRALLEAANEVDVTLSSVPEAVDRILRITGLDEYFPRQ